MKVSGCERQRTCWMHGRGTGHLLGAPVGKWEGVPTGPLAAVGMPFQCGHRVLQGYCVGYSGAHVSLVPQPVARRRKRPLSSLRLFSIPEQPWEWRLREAWGGKGNLTTACASQSHLGLFPEINLRSVQ